MSKLKVGIFGVAEFEVTPSPLDMAYLLAREGYQVEFVASVRPQLAKYYGNLGLCIRRLNMIRKNTTRLRSLEFWFKMIPYICKGYDVVIAVEEIGFLIAHLMKKIGRAKFFVYYSLELVLPKEIRRSFSVRYQSYFIKDTDIVISTGMDRANIMAKEFKLKRTPLVIHNCPLYTQFNKNDYLKNILKEKGFNGNADFIVIYQGALNFDRCILEMISSVKIWDKKAALVIIGYGDKEYIIKIEDTITKLNLKNRVFYLGWIPEAREGLLKLTCGADLGLAFHRWRKLNLAYATYWTPTKLYDYLACGLPVVASDNPSLNFIEEEGFGLCVNPEDPQDIAKTVNKIINDPTLYQKMATNSKTLFIERYNYQRQIRPFIKELNTRLL